MLVHTHTHYTLFCDDVTSVMMSSCFKFDLCLQLARPTEEEAIEVTSLAALGALTMALKGRAEGRGGGKGGQVMGISN